jgi:nickel-dependent lactate racemase
MHMALAWGSQQLDLEVAPEQLVVQHRAAVAAALNDPAAAVRHALEEPLDFPALRRALTPDDHVVVAIDEHAPQLPLLLVPILEHVRAAGVAADAITLLCVPPSTGQPWLEELPDAFQDVRVEVHQPGDRRQLAYLATTKQGRRIYLNRSAVDADQLILLTRRTYDPVVGHAGAATALYPGLSDEATQQEIGAHPRLEAPGAEPWPVEREAGEVAWLLGAPFLVQVIDGTGSEVAHIVAGTAQSSDTGRCLLDARWRIAVDRPADVVIASLVGESARIGMEDIARAFFAAARAVKPGGRIAVLCEAAPAVGRGFDLLRQRDDAAAAQALLMKERPADLLAGFMWASAAQHAHLYLLSGLPSDLVEELFATPLEHAHEVQRLLSGGSMCLLLPDAQKTLAVVAE